MGVRVVYPALILLDERRVGLGKTSEDPIRILQEVYTADGELVVSWDPHEQTAIIGSGFHALWRAE